MEREKLEFDQLSQQCQQAGWIWYGTRTDQYAVKYHDSSDDLSIEEKREKWKQVLTSLKDRPFEQRIKLLSAIASAIRMNRDSLRSVVSTSLLDKDHPLSYSRDYLSEVNLTSESIIFMEAFSDMSDHSRQQKQEFREFMVREAGLKGRVGLPELFPGIIRWIDRDNSRISS